jgi:hypothetical protein
VLLSLSKEKVTKEKVPQSQTRLQSKTQRPLPRLHRSKFVVTTCKNSIFDAIAGLFVMTNRTICAIAAAGIYGE